MTDFNTSLDAAALQAGLTQQDMDEIRQRVAAQMEATEQLMRKFGDRNEQQWADDPNGPRLPAEEVIQRLFIARSRERRGIAEHSEPIDTEDVTAALLLIEDARRYADTRELGIMRAARDLGLTWKQIAAAIGLDSPQAAQQRFDRLVRSDA